jgi:hypothetical protein
VVERSKWDASKVCHLIGTLKAWSTFSLKASSKHLDIVCQCTNPKRIKNYVEEDNESAATGIRKCGIIIDEYSRAGKEGERLMPIA